MICEEIVQPRETGYILISSLQFHMRQFHSSSSIRFCMSTRGLPRLAGPKEDLHSKEDQMEVVASKYPVQLLPGGE